MEFYMIKIGKQLVFIVLSVYLISCASSSPPPKTFNEFLYNQSSMTKQLESLDSNFRVFLLYSGIEGNNYKRISSLNLSNKPVIVGVSQTSTGSPYFFSLLKKAETAPLGKSLFAKDSGVTRDPNMKVDQVYLNYISDDTVKNYIAGLGYTNNDVIYKRMSIFHKDKQSMQVDEYILPSIHNWIK